MKKRQRNKHIIRLIDRWLKHDELNTKQWQWWVVFQEKAWYKQNGWEADYIEIKELDKELLQERTPND